MPAVMEKAIPSTIQFDALWKKLYGPVHGYVLRQVRDRSVADDIVQEIFLKVYAHIDQLHDAVKLDGWLFQIARNAIADYFRQQSRAGRGIPESSVIEPSSSPEETNLTQQLAQWLPTAIDFLPDVYRDALYLTEIEGLSQKEVAERLGLSYSGAKSRVQRGREKLKEIVLQCCEVATDRYGNVLGYHPRRRKCDDNC